MRYLLLPLLVAALSAQAEVRIDDLEARRGDWETYRFPLLSGDSPAIGRINTFLHTLELQALPGRFEQSPFEKVWPKRGEIWGVNLLDYQVVGQGPGYLSVAIEGEYTAAYTSRSTRSYNFDLASGRPIALAQLFSRDGLLRVQREAQAQRAKRMEDFLGQLPPAQAGHAEDMSEDEQWQEDQREMYLRCLDSRRHADLDYDRVQLSGDALTLIAEPCAAHVERALDDLGEFPNRFSYRSLGDDLSPYGRCLLLERRGDCVLPVSENAQGVYRGTLGRYPITLVIERLYADGSLSASYFYDKYAKRIELGGKYRQAVHTLREGGESPARFELERQADGSLKGTWQQGDKPVLDVRLTP
ncbi:hypothetical protein [Phytopseudomonas dryadis]|uniref:DUF3298 domain-containing protein n=1 Tax=Phytopseudomonas dryadis TaxID=2487520 RepID=A0ABY1Z3P2_9GAMM|nr:MULTISPECIES: hypothetical protein [Pseudomonas]TBV03274.1 hypothetical protein DNK34_16940 [Pseudomonas dryadis]TBV16352.1 hypothetical protein DNK41_15825 [Pseudomonas sp. FRB 230]